MTEATIINSLINQVPSAAAVIVVVMLFLRSLEKRDTLFYDNMSKLTERINAMENAIITHDTKMDSHNQKLDEAILDMRAAARRRRQTDK